MSTVTTCPALRPVVLGRQTLVLPWWKPFSTLLHQAPPSSCHSSAVPPIPIHPNLRPPPAIRLLPTRTFQGNATRFPLAKLKSKVLTHNNQIYNDFHMKSFFDSEIISTPVGKWEKFLGSSAPFPVAFRHSTRLFFFFFQFSFDFFEKMKWRPK